MLDEKLITVIELHNTTGLPTSWLYSKAEQGLLPSYKLGRHIRFKPSEVAAWLEAQRRQPQGASR
jgi:excisionase family DNA binding protein